MIAMDSFGELADSEAPITVRKSARITWPYPIVALAGNIGSPSLEEASVATARTSVIFASRQLLPFR
jgi:hypothetical protein